jgi:hypothetical protein
VFNDEQMSFLTNEVTDRVFKKIDHIIEHKLVDISKDAIDELKKEFSITPCFREYKQATIIESVERLVWKGLLTYKNTGAYQFTISMNYITQVNKETFFSERFLSTNELFSYCKNQVNNFKAPHDLKHIDYIYVSFKWDVKKKYDSTDRTVTEPWLRSDNSIHTSPNIGYDKSALLEVCREIVEFFELKHPELLL